jgi:hypothetical protein
VFHARPIDEFACQKVKVIIKQGTPNDTTKTTMDIKSSGTLCRVTGQLLALLQPADEVTAF